MKFTSLQTDATILKELGYRLARTRLERNITQQELADQAGVSKRSVERLEYGAVALQLTSFIRICRALDLLEHLDLFIPEPGISPMQLLKLHGKKRKRGSGKKIPPEKSPPKEWTWGE